MLVHAKATRRASAAFAATCLCTVATPAPGQNLNEILNQLQGMAQSENIKRVQAEWNKLPQSEMACVNQKLSDRGDTIARAPGNPALRCTRNGASVAMHACLPCSVAGSALRRGEALPTCCRDSCPGRARTG